MTEFLLIRYLQTSLSTGVVVADTLQPELIKPASATPRDIKVNETIHVEQGKLIFSLNSCF